eukprot:NODE_349_length_10402_cov_0.251286.p5 type:complete len:242 gc:universal NODE_349_length_10402_cov_0.251286:1489-2214(+)
MIQNHLSRDASTSTERPENPANLAARMENGTRVMKSTGCMPMPRIEPDAAESTSSKAIYATDTAQSETAKSEFMIVDLMDQMMFSIQQMGALLQPEMEQQCLSSLLAKDMLLELVSKELFDRELQIKLYAMEVDYYKAKVSSEMVKLENRKLDFKDIEMQNEICAKDLQHNDLIIMETEQQRQVAKLAQILYDDEDAVDECLANYKDLYAFVDVPNMFIRNANMVIGKDANDVYDMVPTNE